MSKWVSKWPQNWPFWVNYPFEVPARSHQENVLFHLLSEKRQICTNSYDFYSGMSKSYLNVQMRSYKWIQIVLVFPLNPIKVCWISYEYVSFKVSVLRNNEKMWISKRDEENQILCPIKMHSRIKEKGRNRWIWCPTLS